MDQTFDIRPVPTRKRHPPGSQIAAPRATELLHGLAARLRFALRYATL